MCSGFISGSVYDSRSCHRIAVTAVSIGVVSVSGLGGLISGIVNDGSMGGLLEAAGKDGQGDGNYRTGK